MKPMPKRIFSCEKTLLRDRITGADVLKLTDYPAEHMNLYITKSSFTPDRKTIVFLSTRNGWANLFCLDVETGVIRELTNHEDDIEVFSPVIASDGNRAYYSLANTVRAIDMDSGKDTVLARFPNKWPRSLHLTPDGKCLLTVLGPGGRKLGAAIRAVKRSLPRPVYLPSKVLKLFVRICLRIIAKKSWSIVTISTDGAGYRNIAEFDHDIGIVLPSPNNADVAYFLKPEFELWTMKIDGSGNRPLYGHQEKMWLTHPVWLNEHEIVLAQWPEALVAVSLDGRARTVASGNYWHPSASPDGRHIVCDTAYPDRGIFLINSTNGKAKSVCRPESLFGGPQWKECFAEPVVARMPLGNQWAHPHPAFSPDGRHIIYNSNLGTPYSQLFLCAVE